MYNHFAANRDVGLLILAHRGNLVNALLILMPSLTMNNSLLLEPYLTNELIVANTICLSFICILAMVFEVRNARLCETKPVWPQSTIAADSYQGMNSDYRVNVIRKARRVVHVASVLPPIVVRYFSVCMLVRKNMRVGFAELIAQSPSHELARHIQIVNACFREAEAESDPLMAPLQDLLDELVYLHNRIAPKSIFGTAAKSSTRRTAVELYHLMPAMRAYMDRRDDRLMLSHFKLAGCVSALQ
jgi:hypothetical protein